MTNKKLHIKVGDKVYVTAGVSKGKKAEVISINRKKSTESTLWNISLQKYVWCCIFTVDLLLFPIICVGLYGCLCQVLEELPKINTRPSRKIFIRKNELETKRNLLPTKWAIHLMIYQILILFLIMLDFMSNSTIIRFRVNYSIFLASSLIKNVLQFQFFSTFVFMLGRAWQTLLSLPFLICSSSCCLQSSLYPVLLTLLSYFWYSKIILIRNKGVQRNFT